MASRELHAQVPSFLQGASMEAAPMTKPMPEYSSRDGHLWVDGQRLHLKGTCWFGFETSAKVVHGLWSRPYAFFLDFMTKNGFNALRIPFHLELALNDATPSSVDYSANPDLQGLSSLGVMDVIIKAAAERGILVMLDLHSFRPDSFMADGTWCDASHPESMVIDGWVKLLTRYRQQWNVFAVDLKNEPHRTTWGTGNVDTDWNLAATRIANAISSRVSDRFLIFVEGTSNSPSTNAPCFWGENLKV